MDKDIINLSEIIPNKIFQKLQETSDDFLYKRTQKTWESFLSKEYSKSIVNSQVVLDRVWEHLNTGYWKDVKFIWRQLYSFASLMKSVSLYHNGDFEGSLKACDMGLLMGAPIFENILSVLATKLSRCCRRDDETSKLTENTTFEPCKKKSREDGIERALDPRFVIERINAPSLIQFQEKYMKQEKPVILTNCMKHWPAFSHNKWNIDYVKSIAGSRTVPVEIGDKYTSENWTQKLMTINEFIDGYINVKSSTGYLAQHQLFEQIPELRNDITTPDYCYLSERNDSNIVLTHAWFGPKGTVSPLHHDPYQNIFAQVMGSKYIRLYNKNSKYLYPNQDSILDNTSQVDLENINLEKFPNFLDNEYHECILEAGEMLFIPLKWWHFVKSLSTSFSVSFWWK